MAGIHLPRPRGRGFLVLALLAVAGCSGDQQRAAVSGTVQLDGQPVAEGTINFFPTEGTKGPQSGTAITAGKYVMPAATGATIGKNRVEIHALVKTGKQVKNAMSGGLIDEVVEGAPPRYNTKSELVVDVQPGQNQHDFDMKSK